MLGLRVLVESLRNVCNACFTVGVALFVTKDDLESGKCFDGLNVPLAMSNLEAALTFDAYSRLCGVGGISIENLARRPLIWRST